MLWGPAKGLVWQNKNRSSKKTPYQLFNNLANIDGDGPTPAQTHTSASRYDSSNGSRRRQMLYKNPCIQDPAAGVTMVAASISQRANGIATRATDFANAVVMRAAKAPPRSFKDRVGTSKIGQMLDRNTGRPVRRLSTLEKLSAKLDRSRDLQTPKTPSPKARDRLDTSLSRVSDIQPTPEDKSLLENSPQATTSVNEKKAEWQMIARPNWSAFEISVLQSFFELRDEDTSHSLSGFELLKVIQDMGRAPVAGTEDADLMEGLRKKHDLDGNGEFDVDEYLNFVAEFYQLVYSRIFNEFDADKSGTISKKELRAMLRDLQMAGFEARWDEAVHCMTKVDSNEDGLLDINEFAEFLAQYRILEFQHLKKYSGFNNIQILNMQSLFESVDVDYSGCLDVREVVALLAKTTYARSLETQDDLDRFLVLFSRMDVDMSASLDFEEFLRLMRVWMTDNPKPQSKKDENLNTTLLPSHAQDKHSAPASLSDGMKNKREKLSLSRGMNSTSFDSGSFDDHKAASNLSLGAVGENAENEMLAKKFGVSRLEVRALRESFEFCDRDGSGQIEQAELDSLLESLGCAPNTKLQKTCLAKCMEKIEGDIGFTRSVQLVSEYYMAISKSVVEQNAGDSNGSIPLSAVPIALYEAGHYLQRSDLTRLFGEMGLTLDNDADVQVDAAMLSKMFAGDRCNRVLQWRKTCGFSTQQVKTFREACRHYNKAGIYSTEIHIALEDIIRVLTKLDKKPRSEEEVRMLEQAVMRVDDENRGKISFEEVLLLLRHVENYELRRRAVEEKQAAEDCGLSKEQVKELQALFDTHDPAQSGIISRSDVRNLLQDLGVVKTSAQRRMLSQLMQNHLGQQSDLGFAQFMRLLHSLEESLAATGEMEGSVDLEAELLKKTHRTDDDWVV